MIWWLHNPYLCFVVSSIRQANCFVLGYSCFCRTRYCCCVNTANHISQPNTKRTPNVLATAGDREVPYVHDVAAACTKQCSSSRRSNRRRPSCLPSYLILNKLDIRQCALVLISVYFFIGFGNACVGGSRLIWFADEKCADKMITVIIPESHMAPLAFRAHYFTSMRFISPSLVLCCVGSCACVCVRGARVRANSLFLLSSLLLWFQQRFQSSVNMRVRVSVCLDCTDWIRVWAGYVYANKRMFPKPIKW